jgi:FtsH-binding integral membrane protein
VNPTLVAILVGAFLVFGLALARAIRAEPTTRLIVLVTLALSALLILPWAASTPGRFNQLALAFVIALVVGLVGWSIARLRRRDGPPASLPGRQDGNEPR